MNGKWRRRKGDNGGEEEEKKEDDEGEKGISAPLSRK